MSEGSQQPDEDGEDTLAPGTRLGQYEVRRLLGRGGMGSVYEAVHTELKKRVAIKTLHPSVAAIPGARTRFMREGEAASRIRHPHVVDVTDVGTDGGVVYLVMEFLDGEDLATLLERQGALPIAQAVDFLLPVLAAISAAHDEGVIHRDLKPANILLVQTRHSGVQPKVLDFGISKITTGGSGQTLALTGTGATMGTPYYIAPEQIRNVAGVDARSDQYALGSILYECVTGHRAHDGQTIFAILHSVGAGSFPPPRARRPEIPVALESAILRAMRLDPADRFPSVGSFGQALLPFASVARRAFWEPQFQGGGPAEATLSASPGANAGGAVPPSGEIAGASIGGNTTLGDTAAQMVAARVARGGHGKLIGAAVLVAAGAVAAAVALMRPSATVPTSTEPTRSAHRTEGPQVPEAQVSPPPPVRPSRFRVAVVATPTTAALALDGAAPTTGRLARELPVDGAEHTLGVSAPGFQPATVRFRDVPPPDEIVLQPLPQAPDHDRHGGASHAQKAKPHGASVGARPTPSWSPPNNAPIVE